MSATPTGMWPPTRPTKAKAFMRDPTLHPLRLLRSGGQVGLLCLPRSLGLTSAYPGALRRRWLQTVAGTRCAVARISWRSEVNSEIVVVATEATGRTLRPVGSVLDTITTLSI